MTIITQLFQNYPLMIDFFSCKSCSTRQALLTHIREHIAHFRGPYGVLFLLYSVLLTKGKESLKEEIEDVSESLINEQFGHGR